VYRWIDHTAEVELEIEAGSPEAVLRESVQALGELLGARREAPPPAAERPGVVRHRLEVSAPDLPALLAAWLEELVFLAERDGFVARSVDELALDGCTVTARVAGVLGDPPPLVKAVTYHRLAFEPRERGYLGRVVLDV
jgi:SHS2 domain-containing protein